jgi:hypothetical protein
MVFVAVGVAVFVAPTVVCVGVRVGVAVGGVPVTVGVEVGGVPVIVGVGLKVAVAEVVPVGVIVGEGVGET